MAERPDGKSARTERVVFTRPAAERISRVVRTVEAGKRTQSPLIFGNVASAKKIFRICTFEGAWSKGDSKTVTFKYQTTTPNTVTATNLFANVPAGGDCAIARDGTAWFLIAAECDA